MASRGFLEAVPALSHTPVTRRTLSIGGGEWERTGAVKFACREFSNGLSSEALCASDTADYDHRSCQHER